MAVVKSTGEALCQFPLAVVIDVDESGDGRLRIVPMLVYLSHPGSGEIADRLGAVLIAA